MEVAASHAHHQTARGRAPVRWLANGRMLPESSRQRTTQWVPDGAGYSTLTMIDAVGRAATVRVFVE